MAKQKKADSKSTSKRGFVEMNYTPESLYEKFIEYTNWCDGNPIPDERVSKGEILVVNLRRPYTVVGFCVFANINKTSYSRLENKPDFGSVCARIRACVEAQQLDGASVGQFNPAIVSRILSLVDHHDITTNGENLQQAAPTSFNVVVDKDAAAIITSAGKCSILSEEVEK